MEERILFSQKTTIFVPVDNDSRIKPMSKDSLCAQHTDCSGCPKAMESTLIHRNLLRGQHIPKDKCTQNCMLFMIEGELLINSDEHPGTTLHEKQFILQAIGSKYEILALTDVSYILFWFNELPLLCENRYREIIDQAEGPLTYTPMVMNPRLFYLINDVAAYLDESTPACGKYIDLKCQEMVYMITNYYPLPQLRAFFTRSAPIRKVSNTLSCRITAKRRTSKNSHIWEAITPPPSAVSSETYTACPSTNGCWRKNGKASSKTYSTLICGLQRFATGMVSTRCPTLHTSAKTPSETPRAPCARKRPMAKKSERSPIKELFL